MPSQIPQSAPQRRLRVTPEASRTVPKASASLSPKCFGLANVSKTYMSTTGWNSGFPLPFYWSGGIIPVICVDLTTFGNDYLAVCKWPASIFPLWWLRKQCMDLQRAAGQGKKKSQQNPQLQGPPKGPLGGAEGTPVGFRSALSHRLGQPRAASQCQSGHTLTKTPWWETPTTRY